jgi:hypothetical protein
LPGVAFDLLAKAGQKLCEICCVLRVLSRHCYTPFFLQESLVRSDDFGRCCRDKSRHYTLANPR